MAFFFADQGFDVWMNNNRGNRNSRFHKYLDPDNDPEFWDFSFYEFGKYDQPALINFILKTTGVPNISYIGHSQGTTQIFSALSENAEWFKTRVNVFMMLAPVARVDRCSAKHLKDQAENQNLIKFMVSIGPEMFPTPNVNSSVSSGLMKISGAANLGMGLVCDDDPTKISQEGLDTYMGHLPAGTSYRCLDHYRQLILTNNFKKYDHGLEKNLEEYEQTTPPVIDLKSFSGVPIALFCGIKDKLAGPHDYEWLMNQLAEN